jgi:hypothetical protein
MGTIAPNRLPGPKETKKSIKINLLTPKRYPSCCRLNTNHHDNHQAGGGCDDDTSRSTGEDLFPRNFKYLF